MKYEAPEVTKYYRVIDFGTETLCIAPLIIPQSHLHMVPDEARWAGALRGLIYRERLMQ